MVMAFPHRMINSRTILLAPSPAMLDSMVDTPVRKQMRGIMLLPAQSFNFDVLQAPINQVLAKKVASMQILDITSLKKAQLHKNRVHLDNINHRPVNRIAMMLTQDIS